MGMNTKLRELLGDGEFKEVNASEMYIHDVEPVLTPQMRANLSCNIDIAYILKNISS